MRTSYTEARSHSVKGKKKYNNYEDGLQKKGENTEQNRSECKRKVVYKRLGFKYTQILQNEQRRFRIQTIKEINNNIGVQQEPFQIENNKKWRLVEKNRKEYQENGE